LFQNHLAANGRLYAFSVSFLNFATGPFSIIFSLGIAIFEKGATMRIKGGGRYEKAQP
jgi:hypothetical protein